MSQVAVLAQLFDCKQMACRSIILYFLVQLVEIVVHVLQKHLLEQGKFTKLQCGILLKVLPEILDPRWNALGRPAG